jgi:hypothetical protein
VRLLAPGGWEFTVRLCGIALSVLACGTAAAAGDPALQADHEFVRAASQRDAAAVGKLLDNDFSWTDAQGRVLARAQVLSAMPTLALGNEEGMTVRRQSHPQVEAFLVGHEKNYVLRIWVKRAAVWSLLVVQEVALGQPAPPADSEPHDCENPCKSIPYKPKNETEQAVLASWEELETAVATRDSFAWSPHIASEFTMLGSSNDHPLTKADRVSTLNLQRQTGRGALPSPVVFLQLFAFGDSVVMTSVHQPYTGKPVRVSRLWIKRDDKWVMSLSFQTTIEAAAAKGD